MVWLLGTFFLIVILVALYLAATSRHRKSATGDLHLTGAWARVERQLNPEGTILVQGELWRARSVSSEVLMTDSMVRIVGTQGHLLLVKPEPSVSSNQI